MQESSDNHCAESSQDRVVTTDICLSNSPKSNVLFFVLFLSVFPNGAAPQSEINITPFYYNNLLNYCYTFKLNVNEVMVT